MANQLDKLLAQQERATQKKHVNFPVTDWQIGKMQISFCYYFRLQYRHNENTILTKSE